MPLPVVMVVRMVEAPVFLASVDAEESDDSFSSSLSTPARKFLKSFVGTPEECLKVSTAESTMVSMVDAPTEVVSTHKSAKQNFILLAKNFHFRGEWERKGSRAIK